MHRLSAYLRKPILIACLAIAANANADPVLWVDDSSGKLGKVDVSTGAVTLVGTMGAVMTDIAFDPSGHLYGITFGALYSIDAATAATTFIGNLGTSLNSLVFSSIGTLYGANSSLYTINTATGVASLVGNGGASYSSSGDLAFVGGNLFLTSTIPQGDSLIELNTATGAGSLVGSIGIGRVYGLATNDNVSLYGVAGTSVYAVSTATGAGTLLVNYGGHGLGTANGTAFFSEAVPPVPEPGTYALMLVGLGVLGYVGARKSQGQRASAA